MLDVARVREHLARLRELAPDEPAWWRTGPAWTSEQLAAFEAEYGELPAEYRTWLLEIGDGGAGFLAPHDALVPLARFVPDRTQTSRPFRFAKPAQTVTHPIGGVLYLGEVEARYPAFLVVRGPRAGEVWIDRTRRRDGAFACEGTFGELTRRWIATSGSALLQRDRTTETPTWVQLCRDVVASLRGGVDAFAIAFDALDEPKQREATATLASLLGAQIERWLFDPRLAGTAALALTTCLDRINRPRTRVERALAAIADDSEMLDLAPEKVAELLAACRESKTHEDAHLFWFERELRAAGRLDEAIATFRTRAVWQGAEYVELARALIAAGRAREAIAIGEELAARSAIRGLEWARGWILVEAGRVDDGKRMLAQFVAREVDPRRQQLVAALHTAPLVPASPDDITFVASTYKPIPLHAATVYYELTSLLFAIGQDPESALDAAVRALSFHGVRRHAQEHANHQACLRIAQAMLGRAVETETQLTADFHTVATHRLAERLLGKLPPLGIELVVRHRYR